MPQRTCSLPDCDQPHRARGLCRRHYKQAHELHDVVCVECGSKFRSTRTTGKLCSDDCRSEHYSGQRRTSRPLVHVPNAPAFTWLPAQHPVMRRIKQRKPHVWYSGMCGWCGESYTDWQPASRYCSKACQRDASGARHGRFVVPRSVRLAIYARDDWTCQLCLEAVDRNLVTLDPFNDWAPSLDHVTPQSKGGTHEPSNLRLAHRWCNAVRGDGSLYTEDDLRLAAA